MGGDQDRGRARPTIPPARRPIGGPGDGGRHDVPAHPPLAAALLMIGAVVLIVAIAALDAL